MILGLGKAHELPDYRLQIVDRYNVRQNLQTFENSTAADGLTWTCEEPYPMATARRLRLVDVDQVDNDFIDEVAIEGEQFSSELYRYDVEYTRSIKAGLFFFLFSTPVGWILLALFVVTAIFMASFYRGTVV